MKPSPEKFLESLAPLCRDSQLIARRAVAAGARAIGFVGEGVPVALILAADALPVRLRAHPDEDASPVADLVESSFSTETRLIAARWLAGAFDHLEAVIFPRGDDSAQRLYYYLCELQRRGQCRGPRPLLYDVAGLPRRASFEHTLDSTRRLAVELGASTDALEPAMQRVARRDALLRAVRARRLQPTPLRGSAGWTLEFAASCDWREEFDGALRAWLDQAEGLDGPRRVLVAGSPLPDARLHGAIEDDGACVVRELTGVVESRDEVDGDAFVRLATTAQRHLSPALAMRQDGHCVADHAVRDDVDAVILWLCESDEALPWEIARQQHALRERGVPTLLLARQPWRITSTALDAVRTFIRSPGATS